MSSTMLRAEPPHARAFPGWIVASFVALLVVALGGGFLLGQGLHSSPQGLAPDSVVKLLDDGIAAVNAGDVNGFAATFAQNAVFTNAIEGTEQVGASEIASYYAPQSLLLTRTSEVVMDGRYASYAFQFTGGDGERYSAIATCEIQSGQIIHEWVVGA